MSKELSDLIAKRFIARRDVKAIQYADGAWSPHTNGRIRGQGDRLPWTRADILAHLAGEQTFGHYLLGEDSSCKLFAFDIDLDENRPEGHPRGAFTGQWVDNEGNLHDFDAREDWKDRRHPGRTWSKYQLKMLGTSLMARITDELGLHCAAAYSGNKGIHVYGFMPQPMPAADAREGAMIVLETLGGWEPSRGDNFYRAVDPDPVHSYPNLTIEVFPKQDSLEGKSLGNLMRLPLGRNLKSKDPTFFIDMTTPMAVMAPVDPIRALTTSPWKSPNE